MGLSGFDFLLQKFSENTKITEQEKPGLLTKIHEYEVNIDGENKVFQFKFIEELAETVYRLAIYKSGIDEYTCQNIANIINNLSKVGLTSKDLYFNGNMSFVEVVVTLINDIFNSEINKSGYNFNSQGIANTLNGLAKLGYKSGDLEDLNIKALTEQINNQIDNFNSQGIANTLNGLTKLGYRKKDLSGLDTKALTELINNRIGEFEPQEIANTFNGLAKLGYTSEDLKDLNIKALTEQINNQIDNFKSQEIAVTLHGLGKIGYNFDELKESNIIQNLLKKFNSIQKNKTVLDYLTLMKGLVATVYDIKQDNLKEEQKQYLNELKETIGGDVEQIVKGTKEKRKEITNAIKLDDLNRVLIILGKQQAELEQQTKKVIEDEQRLEINIRRCENARTAKMKYKLSATAETNEALNNITDAVLQK